LSRSATPNVFHSSSVNSVLLARALPNTSLGISQLLAAEASPREAFSTLKESLERSAARIAAGAVAFVSVPSLILQTSTHKLNCSARPCTPSLSTPLTSPTTSVPPMAHERASRTLLKVLAFASLSYFVQHLLLAFAHLKNKCLSRALSTQYTSLSPSLGRDLRSTSRQTVYIAQLHPRN
jgi:hypothetical protein